MTLANKTSFIFDFDGTIADSIPLIFSVIKKVGPEYGYGVLTDEDIAWIREHHYRDLLKRYKIPLYKIPFFLARGRYEIEQIIHTVKPCVGMIDFLQELKATGKNLGILSSSKKDMILKFLERHNIVSLFDFVHSELNIFGKDKALISVMAKNKIQKDQAVYFGDEIRDIEACRKIGVDIVSVSWGFNAKDALLDHNAQVVVDSPEEILKLTH